MLGGSNLDGRPCWHIHCERKEGGLEADLFVDKESYGVARIEIASTLEKYTSESHRTLVFMPLNGQWSLKSSVYSWVPQNQKEKEIVRICAYRPFEAERKRDYLPLRKIAKTALNHYESDFTDDFWGGHPFVPVPEEILTQMN